MAIIHSKNCVHTTWSQGGEKRNLQQCGQCKNVLLQMCLVVRRISKSASSCPSVRVWSGNMEQRDGHRTDFCKISYMGCFIKSETFWFCWNWTKIRHFTCINHQLNAQFLYSLITSVTLHSSTFTFHCNLHKNLPRLTRNNIRITKTPLGTTS